MRQYLSDAVDDYLRFRRSQDYSKGTIAHDRSILKKFLSSTGNLDTRQIEDRHVSAYFDKASLTRQPQSLRIDHNVLSKFFAWCRNTRRMPIDNDPLYGRRRPRDVKRERNRIPVSQFAQLLDEAGQREARDRAVVAVLLYTLLRDQEAASIRISDVDLAGGWIRARIHKTNVEDRIPISKELDGELRRWMAHYTERVGVLDPRFVLLPRRKTYPVNGEGGRIVAVESIYQPELQMRALGRIVNPVLQRMGFPITDEQGRPIGEGAHTIRRSGARALFDSLANNGYDNSLRLVQSLLHHRSVTQTEAYVGVTADRRTRDEVLRGQEMYPMGTENVITLRPATAL